MLSPALLVSTGAGWELWYAWWFILEYEEAIEDDGWLGLRYIAAYGRRVVAE